MTNVQENTQRDGVRVLCKRVGETPLECVERFRAEHPDLGGVPLTYAGRLDPIAEGVLLVLSGEAILRKDEYLGLPKKYTVEVLWGAETDTLDVLGMVSRGISKSVNVPTVDTIADFLMTQIGKIIQKYPAYSSKPVDGKPLFQWAREGRLSEIKIPEHEVGILERPVFKGRREISGSEVSAQIKEKILSVKGDFRQKESIERWEEVLRKNGEENFIIDTIELTVSSGFYVRQFVSDLAETLGTSATTFHICRTQVGDFCVE
jgi:tRNA pseudouridine(55) synthase